MSSYWPLKFYQNKGFQVLQYLVLSPVQLHPLKEGSYVPATTLPHQEPELGTELLKDKGCKIIKMKQGHTATQKRGS